ncbi:MAG: SH3 domain-containing protein, partial [Flavobacteriales bacterium]|nr:SH3 domain-containing protein [Flavobacteriales bacterium]
MKKLILIFLLLPLLGITQVTVNVDSYLNLREEPNTSCRVIGKLVDTSVVTYAGEWRDGFIKVRQYFPPENDELLGDTKEGWVSSSYVSVPLLTSDILEPFEYI